MERIVRIEDLCKCEPDSFMHIEHQLCQSCRRNVPVPLDTMGFTNSVSWCSKCPEGSTGHNLREMLKPMTVKII